MMTMKKFKQKLDTVAAIYFAVSMIVLTLFIVF